MKKRSFIESLNLAIDGIIYVLRTQRNLRIHFAAALMVLGVSLFLDLSRVEMIVLILTIAMVIVAELINTAIETAVDTYLVFEHPLAKIAKDVAAGAVLVASLTAMMIGYLLFFNRLNPLASLVIQKVAQSSPYLTVTVLLIVAILIVSVKAVTGRGTPLSGGFPSGHSALAFSVFTLITLVSQSYIIASLALLMALLVAQSRLESNIHSLFEVASGGILGILITLLIFQIVKLYIYI